MIENSNVSKTPSASEFVDIKKYIGVASINVLSINPNNDTLKKYGWTIPEDAEEPKYVTEVERDGKRSKAARVRFLVQIQDLEDKPVISLDFWVRPEYMTNKEGSKMKIIDAYGRTAWATKEEIKAKKVPQYSSGPANICTPYRACHSGEEELIQFLMKYLNVTPLQVFDRKANAYVNTKNPGRLTIDNWSSICEGNVTELRQYIALQPENRVKVILGVRTTDDNKSYQTFMNARYIGNGATPDASTGEYTTARKEIDKFTAQRPDSPYSFSASLVKEWKTTASDVKDNADDLFNETTVSDDMPFDID